MKYKIKTGFWGFLSWLGQNCNKKSISKSNSTIGWKDLVAQKNVEDILNFISFPSLPAGYKKQSHLKNGFQRNGNIPRDQGEDEHGKHGDGAAGGGSHQGPVKAHNGTNL